MIIDTILGNLLQNEQYARKVLPFLKENIFSIEPIRSYTS